MPKDAFLVGPVEHQDGGLAEVYFLVEVLVELVEFVYEVFAIEHAGVLVESFITAEEADVVGAEFGVVMYLDVQFFAGAVEAGGVVFYFELFYLFLQVFQILYISTPEE